MLVGIVGYGVVGKHLESVFADKGHTTPIYDKNNPDYCSQAQREAINSCDLVFVAVPTPESPDGSCDISAVEEVVGWIEPPICIKSTVPPGTTRKLSAATGKHIVFSPEYVGETPFHKYHYRVIPDLVAIGGDRAICDLFTSLFRDVLGPEPRYFITDSTTAELAKYMENCFFATKVAFVAQFFLLAECFGADFTEMREIWVADTRIGRSHSTVVGALGFGGRCLPKDLSAIIASALEADAVPSLLEAVQAFNLSLRA